jgi:hypothetical protein
MANEVMLEFQQNHPDFLRWYLSCQPQMMMAAQQQLPEKKMAPPSPSFASLSPTPSMEDQPLDLSAKRLNSFGYESRSRQYASHGVSPLSPTSSEDEDVEEHFRKSGMVLDLSRK